MEKRLQPGIKDEDHFYRWLNEDAESWTQFKHLNKQYPDAAPLPPEEMKALRQKIAQDFGHVSLDAGDADAHRWCLENYFDNPDSLLDMGCGNGLFSMAYRILHGARVTGIDAAKPMIDLARRLRGKTQLDGVNFICKRSDRTELPDNLFDVAYSQHFLEHVPCPEATLREMLRLAPIVCGFVPYDRLNDDSTQHLWHWTEETLLELMQKVFGEKCEVKRFNVVIAFGGTR